MNEGIKPRPFFLAVLAVFKNESHVIKEWLEHYLNQGVDHFYLIDNGSDDQYYSIIEPYISAGYVDLFYDPSRCAQKYLYNKYALKSKHTFDWLMVVDLDEFIYARQGFHSVAKYLSSMLDVSQVLIPWKIFGSNACARQPSSVIQGFTRRGYFPQIGKRGKSIVRSDVLIEIEIHRQKISAGVSIFPDGTLAPDSADHWHTDEGILKAMPLHLNHYQIQSKQWFESVKMTRGDAVFGKNPRSLKIFKEIDTYCNQYEDIELRNISLNYQKFLN